MKKKILFFINTSQGGGAEKVLVDLISSMNPEQFDITLVTICGGIHEERIPKTVSHKKIVKSRSAFWCRLLYSLVVHLPAWLFSRLFLRGSYDIEIAYLEGSPTRFIAAKNSCAAKIAFVHCNLAFQKNLLGYYKDEKECLREYQGFTRVCFVSQQGREGFENVVGKLDNACVVHNVLNINELRAMAAAEPPYLYQTTGWKLVAVGRLAREKAFERLLQVVCKLEKSENFELWIIGEGEKREELEAIIREHNIHSVKLLGYHKNPYPLVKQADLFICSSLTEGYSTAVTEAVALGVPVLTTDCAGMNEILEAGNLGMIVENSEEGLHDGLLELIRDEKKYQTLKQQVLGKSVGLTNEQAMQEYTELFRSVTRDASL